LDNKPNTLNTTETSFADGRIVDASSILAEWLRKSRGARNPEERIRAHMLAIHLALLAGRRLRARRHLRALESRIPTFVLLPLKARLALLDGKAGEATQLCDTALDSLESDGSISLRASLLRQRGLIRLQAAQIAEAFADLFESLRLAKIAGEKEAAVETRLDIAEAALAFGDTATAAKIIPTGAELHGRFLLRAKKMEWLLAGACEPCTSPVSINKPKTFHEAEHLLERARIVAEQTDIDSAQDALLLLETGGWLEAVEQYRGEANLLDAEITLESGEPEKALALVREARCTLSPGLTIRLDPALRWLEVGAYIRLGDHGAALRLGRKLIKDLELLRAGLFALNHLRRFSNDCADLYRAIIALEIQHGQAKKAFEALQHFSARVLLRKAGAAPATGIATIMTASPEGETGGWVLRNLFRHGRLRGAMTPNWRKTIEILTSLGSEDAE